MAWTSKGIEERGSPDLKEIIFIITQGNKPGTQKEDEKKDGKTQIT